MTGNTTLDAAEAKYREEREKRIRPDGMKQFVDLYAVDKFQKFLQDPWVAEKKVSGVNGHYTAALSDGQTTDILIIGAGYGGLLFAARLIDSGVDVNRIRLVDNAGSFGGTWYWNRYPGLMCDIESYIYMPLLEETGYMPSKKYASGQELREYADLIAAKWNLTDKALFRSRVDKLAWDDNTKEWTVSITKIDDNESETPLTVKSRFAVLASGFTVIPHIPTIPGLTEFKGSTFHTARWDYTVTGGTSGDPRLTALQDKRVGIIGTGATAVQVVPAVAKWAKSLYVFQRTPSAVDERNNAVTDPEKWTSTVANNSGWQKARSKNFTAFLSDLPAKPEVNLVNDGWTTMLSYSAIISSSGKEIKSADNVAERATYLHAIDFPRQQTIRDRVDRVVSDRDTADKLKAWYPGWCKRPCFHDDYLGAFNQPNVTLVDTNGRGVELITENGVVVDGTEHPLEVLILSTGYRSPFLYSPCGRVNIDIRGRNNTSLDDKWNSGVTTLHGVMSHDFPNLFWPGFSQAGGSPNFAYCIDISAQHVAAIFKEACTRVPNSPTTDVYKYNFTIEATSEAEEAWSEKVASMAGVFAASAGCTPSYINAEGEYEREVAPEVLKRRARGALWAKGMDDFEDTIKEWETKGGFEGVDFVRVE
ncbi:hypothetical protein SEUCBS140593_005419 [Sporothrix eucalyptigena]|uniref:FAD/NAD(P)-binding domain-containing protein n=1 Tax=Sporothrix eucalyptigena TaxID=1812306 RepID=A0ABP0BWY7_9PEZI